MNSKINYSSKAKSKGRKNFRLSDLAEEVKKEFFADENLFKDLFKLKSSTCLDKVFDQLELMVKYYANSVTTSQLRNVYAEIVKTKKPNDLKLLRPKLAYIAARQDHLNAKKFMAFIDHLIQQVNTEERIAIFQRHYGGHSGIP